VTKKESCYNLDTRVKLEPLEEGQLAAGPALLPTGRSNLRQLRLVGQGPVLRADLVQARQGEEGSLLHVPVSQDGVENFAGGDGGGVAADGNPLAVEHVDHHVPGVALFLPAAVDVQVEQDGVLVGHDDELGADAPLGGRHRCGGNLCQWPDDAVEPRRVSLDGPSLLRRRFDLDGAVVEPATVMTGGGYRRWSRRLKRRRRTEVEVTKFFFHCH
jgi:hypothetical protein